MKDNEKKDLSATADTAEAEKEVAATDTGKFKDVKSLLEAYKALEAEFTRRSQRLKELEASKAEEAPARADNAEEPSQGAAGDGISSLTEEVKNAVIEEYLNGLRANRAVPFVTGGGAVAAKRRVPSTVREAGALAKNYFNNREDK